ncbi:MAG: phosphopantothenoylcysteine decarboxylase, partial [candidate division Zixibacteria bacterium]|nr:phosphopantothenoylcysteine decarboxylase [candidate division Zixibacteria bacterium]
IMSAAPADFTPVKPLAHKIKRRSDHLSLEFEATGDILKKVSATKRKGQLLVGFALETDNAIANARNKLRDKNLDLIVLNQPGSQSGFSSDTNQVTILRPDKKPLKWPLLEKQQVAFKLLELLSTMM